MTQFSFTDGTVTSGEVVAKAMNVLIVKNEEGQYFMVNRNALAAEDPYALIKD